MVPVVWVTAVTVKLVGLGQAGGLLIETSSMATSTRLLLLGER